MSLLDFGLLALASLFTMINPIGVVVLFSGLTSSLERASANRIALKAALYAAGILLAFALTGKLIFDFFQISVNGLRVVGGIVFFMMGYEMLQARLSPMNFDDPEDLEPLEKDISLTPLAIPMIAGPGAIATVILFINEQPDPAHRAVLFTIIVAVCLLTYLGMLGANRLNRLIGEQGNKVIMRIMGLIVMVIAVEFFFAGLTPYVQTMMSTG
ncbi:MAG: MarC family protein [Alphaproteobacteria bacterium]|nr:MAG: MarC family protein [Alphaproteobacteria bacterium]